MGLGSHIGVISVLLASISKTILCEEDGCGKAAKDYFRCYLKELESIIPKSLDTSFDKVSQCFQSSGCKELRNPVDHPAVNTFFTCFEGIGNDMANAALNPLAKSSHEDKSDGKNDTKKYFDENSVFSAKLKKAIKLGIAFQNNSSCTAAQRTAIGVCLNGLTSETSSNYVEPRRARGEAKKKCFDKVTDKCKEHVKVEEEKLAKEASTGSMEAGLYIQKFDNCIGRLLLPESKGFIDSIIAHVFKSIRTDL